MLFDAHSHLDLMREEERNLALSGAKTAGIMKIISCSTSFASNEKNLELAKNNPEILPAIGLYPLDAMDLTPLELDKAFYFFNAEISKATAVGEVGLDYKYAVKKEDQKKQEDIFSRFIELSKESKKPLIIHSRYAQSQVLKMLEESNAKKALLHSFVDSEKLMKKAAEKEYFVSVGLNVLENENIQKNILAFPLNNLLFETDSPIRFSGEKAMPAKIKLIAQKVAELKSLSLKEVEDQQEKNFKKLFF
ncbi:Tat-linked quality control protein TatD [uncultured archaeon]|nr:Tat-linked quality control protein TatD [uncultured archaeon]